MNCAKVQKVVGFTSLQPHFPLQITLPATSLTRALEINAITFATTNMLNTACARYVTTITTHNNVGHFIKKETICCFISPWHDITLLGVYCLYACAWMILINDFDHAISVTLMNIMCKATENQCHVSSVSFVFQSVPHTFKKIPNAL